MPFDEDGTTATGGVTFINRFTVTAEPAEFESVFAQTARFLAGRDGYLSHTLLRHPDREDQYVNVARWRSAEEFHRAVRDPAFRPHAEAVRRLATGEPTLYVERQSVVAAGAGGDGRIGGEPT